MKKRSHRLEKMARVYDDEILPIWSLRFGKMLLRGLELPPKAMVLDYGCGTGFPSLEVLKRMDEQGRIIALDPAGSLLDVARKKAGGMAGKRIFFRSETPSAKLGFADDVYDLVMSNVALSVVESPPQAIKEFARVTKPKGQVIVTLPLAGTYREFYDIYREVLTKNDRHSVLERLEVHIAQIPSTDEVAGWFEAAGLPNPQVEMEEFSLLFMSSREFFFAPVIEFGPLSSWKEVAGKGKEMQEIFWHIKESIDAYFGDRAFEITVKAGCFRGIKPEHRPEKNQEVEEKKDPVVVTPPAPAPSPGNEEKNLPAIEDDFKLDDEEEDTGA